MVGAFFIGLYMKIAIVPAVFAKDDISPLLFLYEKGVHCVQNARGRALLPPEIISLIADCEGIIVGEDNISAAIMALSPRLKVISVYGNTDQQVDVDYAKTQGISVMHTKSASKETNECTWQCVHNLCAALNI